MSILPQSRAGGKQGWRPRLFSLPLKSETTVIVGDHPDGLRALEAILGRQFGCVFVLALGLSAIGSSIEGWMGKESAFSRVWHSGAFTVVDVAVTFVLVVLAMALLR